MNQDELVEKLSDAAHQGWMEGKQAAGVSSRKSEDGEELMVPYADLSEKAKDLDRYNVRAVLAAIHRAGLALVPHEKVAQAESIRAGLDAARKHINTYLLYGGQASPELRANLEAWGELLADKEA